MISAAIELSCGQSNIKVLPFGAHILSWKHQGKEQLWLSEWAELDGSAPIRGGIPLCCPWFAKKNDDLPFHGFFRTMLWQEGSRKESGKCSELVFELRDNSDTKAIWPHQFHARYIISLSQDSLNVQLQVTNCDHQPFEISDALHSYFSVNDHQRVSVPELEGYKYFDKYAGVLMPGKQFVLGQAITQA